MKPQRALAGSIPQCVLWHEAQNLFHQTSQSQLSRDPTPLWAAFKPKKMNQSSELLLTRPTLTRRWRYRHVKWPPFGFTTANSVGFFERPPISRWNHTFTSRTSWALFSGGPGLFQSYYGDPVRLPV